jgi:hypothetical protein
MKALLRLPASLVAALITVFLAPTILIVSLKPFYIHDSSQNFWDSLISLPYVELINTVGVFLLFIWIIAITAYYCKSLNKSWIIITPALSSFFFTIVITPILLHDMYYVSGVVSPLAKEAITAIRWVSPLILLITAIVSLLITNLIVVFVAVRLTVKDSKEWLLVPFLILAFPIGIFIVHSRIRAKLTQQPEHRLEDHLVV